MVLPYVVAWESRRTPIIHVWGHRDIPPLAVELHMDTSNVGLAILNPSSYPFLQIQFDDIEKNMISRSATTSSDISINRTFVISTSAMDMGFPSGTDSLPED
ncbi:LOW QUALITY PROTEIN: hypothetical protein PHMEG_0008268 [Phytophthora megakarya]|uniref:Uncharacterized protein n=1 Tax=Phytophthora megakarya TaxID=4795 RepID=A0A225WLK8_9STRA|nr:LOW QUALITY PROTEIN: hypothetical protein PHMEG_0008268 [Phytophthora megakarya]